MHLHLLGAEFLRPCLSTTHRARGQTLWLALLLSISGLAAPAPSPWQRSLVTIEVTRNQYDYVQPWSKRSENYVKSAVVVSPTEVLTTADQLADRTLVRLQRGGRGAWYEGRVEWIDYHVNLALVSCADSKFWEGLKPVRFSPKTPAKGSVQIARWRDGGFEIRKGDINRVTVKRGKLTILDHLHLEIDCDLKAAGWSEPVIQGSRVVGLTVSQDSSGFLALPSSLIHSVLDARRRGTYRGLGYFAFVWQRAENPAIHRWLQQTGGPRGVLVIETPARDGNAGVLQPQDILLNVDGFDIDIQGDYVDPDHGELMLENLATRGHWAGDEIPIRIWRQGRELEVKYRLPAADYRADLVPQEVFDTPPQYLMVGGLVFQPLTEPFLRSWGADWRRRVPFRLGYYEREKPTAERPSRVVLSLVLPDPYNLGYEEARYLAVDTVNGRRISTVAEAQEAFRHPPDGFHVVEFERGDSLRRIVLDAAGAEAATQRILQRYGIPEASFVLPPGK